MPAESNKEIRSVRVLQVIEIEVSRGTGDSKVDPLRSVFQYWTTDGILLSEHDTLNDTPNIA